MRISDWRSDVCSSDLVVPRNQIYTAFRLETPFRQRLDRLEQTDQRSLVVDGAASPYRLFGDRPGEGRIFPVLFGPLGHWNDVLMRHDDDRRERRVAARPMIDERTVRQDRTRTRLSDHGIGPRDERKSVAVGKRGT